MSTDRTQPLTAFELTNMREALSAGVYGTGWIRAQMYRLLATISARDAQIAELRGTPDHIKQTHEMVGQDVAHGTDAGAAPNTLPAPDGVERGDWQLWRPADQTMRGMEPGAGDYALVRKDMIAVGVLYGGYTGADNQMADILAAMNDRKPSPASGDATEFADDAISWLNELPDRTSPDDWPEACLVTGDELHGYLVEQLQEFLTSDRAATERRVREEHLQTLTDLRRFIIKRGYDDMHCGYCDKDWETHQPEKHSQNCIAHKLDAAIRAGKKE